MRVWRSWILLVLFPALYCATAESSFGQGCRVTTTIRVLDGRSQSIADLAPEQLNAQIGGLPAKVLSASRLPKPTTILLIDISSSMKGELEQSVTAAKQLLANAGDNVAVVAFRERIVAYEEGKQATGELLDRLTNQKPSGAGTAIWDTLVEVAAKVKKPNTVLVVISDGKDNVSHHSALYALDAFRRNRWPSVFGLVLDYFHHDESPELAKHADFSRIVAESGGEAEYPLSAADITVASSKLSSEISAPFTIGLQASQPIPKAQTLTIETTSARGKSTPHLKILHVSKISECDEP